MTKQSPALLLRKLLTIQKPECSLGQATAKTVGKLIVEGSLVIFANSYFGVAVVDPPPIYFLYYLLPFFIFSLVNQVISLAAKIARRKGAPVAWKLCTD